MRKETHRTYCHRIFWSLLSYVAAPFFCVYALCSKKLRKSFTERLGLGSWKKLAPSDDYIWIHGASVGEINGLDSLIRKFAKTDGLKQYRRIITTTSLTGAKTVQDRKYAYFNTLLPLDAPCIVKSIVERVRPKFFVCTETELWPNLFFALKDKNVPIFLVNARISDYSFPQYRRFKGLFKPMLQCLDLVFAQTTTDAERFIQLGVSNDRVHVVGSTKYDKPKEEFSSEQMVEYKTKLSLEPTWPTFIAGSVGIGEYPIVISAYKEVLISGFSNLQLIIAPRHVENSNAIAEELEAAGLKYVYRSKIADASCCESHGNNNDHHNPDRNQTQVILLDTMGELSRLYAISDIVFVGGSLVDIGGHNPLEASAYAKPIIMGQYTCTVREVVTDLKQLGGLLEVTNERELTEAVILLLKDKQKYESTATSALSVWKKHQGATDVIIDKLVKSNNFATS